MNTYSQRKQSERGKAKQIVRLSKKISWALRHGALESNLEMDGAGWVEVDALLRQLRITEDELQRVIELNDKQRLERDGAYVRASQGHSLDNGWICRDALERSWVEEKTLSHMWHGTALEAIEGIAHAGLQSIGRTHVHCCDAPTSRVGKRAAVPIMLRIDLSRLRALGYRSYRASNGVLLTRAVPRKAIDGYLTMSRRARMHAERIEQLLGVEALEPP